MKEPAIIGAAVAAIFIAVIRGFIGEETVSFEVETAITTVVIFVVGIVVRQLVMPTAKLKDTKLTRAGRW